MRPLWLVCVVLACFACGCESPLEIDRDTEIAIGRQGAADLEKQYGVVTDPAMQQRLNAIGPRIAAASQDPSLPWTFKVLNSKEVNAVCLPGGFVYVFKGMMDYVKSDDQLAGVLAHEVVHADHHHSKAAIEKAMTAGLLAELVTQKSSTSIKQAAQIALELEMRDGYRDKEYEADHYGTEYAFRAGYRASGLRSLLEFLYTKEGDPARVTWLLQTHPPLSKRIERLDQYIPQLTGKPVGQS
ncbi:MAG: M48 family metalloprotease [Armatimonadota bacterium]